MVKKSKIVKSSLLQSLEFLLTVPRITTDSNSVYCNIINGFAIQFNSIVAVGTPILLAIDAAPHTNLLERALAECGEGYKIVQLSPERLAVRSDDFQAFIPCAVPETLSQVIPDAPIAVLDDRLIVALKKCAAIADAKAKTVLESCICLSAGHCIASDNRVIIQAWHGIDLPDKMLLPKMAVGVIAKTKKKLAKFGYSYNQAGIAITATFYFDDETWLRTNLYQERYPDILRHLNVETQRRPVPAELFTAAQKVSPFSVTNEVFIKEGLISSESEFGKFHVGSELKLPIAGDHAPRIYYADDLAIVAKHAVTWDEITNKGVTYFFGENLRGALFSREYSEKAIAQPITDEDVPF